MKLIKYLTDFNGYIFKEEVMFWNIFLDHGTCED